MHSSYRCLAIALTLAGCDSPTFADPPVPPTVPPGPMTQPCDVLGRPATVPFPGAPGLVLLCPGAESVWTLPDPGLADATILAPSDAQLRMIKDGVADLSPGVRSSLRGFAVVSRDFCRGKIERDTCQTGAAICAPNAAAAEPARCSKGICRRPDGKDRSKTVTASTKGGTIFINSVLFADGADAVKQTLAHETAHAYQCLLDPASCSKFEDRFFPDNWRELASRTVGGYLYGTKFEPYWGAIQATGVRLAVSRKYGDCTMDNYVINGFPSAYAQMSDAWEDSAELVAAIVAPEAGSTAGVCSRVRSALQAQPDKFQPAIAIIYAKMNLLTTLGFVSENQLMACVGPPIEERFGPGIHLFKAPKFSRPDTTLVASPGTVAGWGDINGTRYLKVFGDSKTGFGRQTGDWNAMIGVRDTDDNPLGLYALARKSDAFVQATKTAGARALLVTATGSLAVTYAKIRGGNLCKTRGLIMSGTQTGRVLFELRGSTNVGIQSNAFHWGVFSVSNPTCAGP